VNPTLANIQALIEKFRVELHDGAGDRNIFEAEAITLKGIAPGWLAEKVMPLSWDVVTAPDFDVAAGAES
jgi:hypothetical protein